MSQQIDTRSGIKIEVDRTVSNDQVQLSLQARTPKEVVLYWTLLRRPEDAWQIPPQSYWPEGTSVSGASAAQTRFAGQNGERRVTLRFDHPSDFSLMDFALYFPQENRWDNNQNRNYRIALAASPAGASGASPAEVLQRELAGQEVPFQHVYDIEEGQLAVAVLHADDRYRLTFVSNLPAPLVLHWGVAQRSRQEWLAPPPPVQPPGTILFQSAAETPFEVVDGLKRLQLEFPQKDSPLGIPFVLRRPEVNRWIKDRGGNFFVPLAASASADTTLSDGEVAQLADEIIRAETTHNSWTLMHRYNLCHDLLDRVRGNVQGLALLFVWMRFSAIRQLDWQRNYNTQPRELGHAQDRLTLKLADRYVQDPAGRAFYRLILSTVGRGGDGQKIRDEVLAIMHRHHIKEVTGHFMEEWHQKLHNNTTPDDVVIAEAYLEFLRSNGNHQRFYDVLQAGGVTRERLESFERPIRAAPDFVGHLKEGLIHDFENFLRTLKAVHSGTDFETAINTAGYLLDDDLRGRLWHLWRHQNDPPNSLVILAYQAFEARRDVLGRMGGNQGLRELLYLDLAVEQHVRTIVERSLHLHLGRDPLVDLIGALLENLVLLEAGAEFGVARTHWQRLQSLPRFTAEWSLNAKAVIDRITRALGEFIDRYRARLQPCAEVLGNGFHAAPWSITLFSEEVIRGGLASTLSMLVRQLQPVLRETAHVGNWQVISRGSGTGEVQVMRSLMDGQGANYAQPTALVAEAVSGEEEIPGGVVAVILGGETDILSHVAVRARDAGVLFATCYDSQVMEQLKALRGRLLSFSVNSDGEVVFQEATAAASAPAPRAAISTAGLVRPRFKAYAIPASEFNERVVGGKSCNQMRLHGKLPDWVRQPASVAIPFGVCEQVLELQENAPLRQRFEQLVSSVESGPPKILSQLRQTLQQLTAPSELPATLRQAMQSARLPAPEPWDDAWQCIKRVWASKWNERAWLSRQAHGIRHDDLFMAVLIQQVVEADYAYVIHTVNPSTGDRGELYAEVVLGLGETLVGNYPGRALSFVSSKETLQSKLIAYPSKSIGLYGGGLIFRSDSNGEDLPGYAGAGLYDSVMLKPPRDAELDYSQERLVWDENFREELMRCIAKIGVAVENAFGSPQDIEGAIAHGEYYVVQSRDQATDAATPA